MAVGTYLWLLLLWLVGSLARDAELIAPDSAVAFRWQAGARVLTLIVFMHVAAACLRGGKLRWFFWPFNIVWLVRRWWRGGYYAAARDAVWDFVSALRLPYYFWLGVRGFAGAVLWLAIPVTLLASSVWLPVLGVLGAVLLIPVLLWLPFVQARFAAEDRFRAFLELGAVRQAYCRAPWAHALAVAVTYTLALPLFLLKIEVTPREALWLPALAFIIFSIPARVLVGWSQAPRPAQALAVHLVRSVRHAPLCCRLSFGAVPVPVHLVVRHRQPLRAASVSSTGALFESAALVCHNEPQTGMRTEPATQARAKERIMK